MPMTTEVMRATLTSVSGLAWPFLRISLYTSWAKDADAVIVRPATTARMVAKATPEMMPMKTSPPSSRASSGAAELAAEGAARIAF